MSHLNERTQMKATDHEFYDYRVRVTAFFNGAPMGSIPGITVKARSFKGAINATKTILGKDTEILSVAKRRVARG